MALDLLLMFIAILTSLRISVESICDLYQVVEEVHFLWLYVMKCHWAITAAVPTLNKKQYISTVFEIALLLLFRSAHTTKRQNINGEMVGHPQTNLSVIGPVRFIPLPCYLSLFWFDSESHLHIHLAGASTP